MKNCVAHMSAPAIFTFNFQFFIFAGWGMENAQEACETVFDRAWSGEPQIIMRDDKPMVVVVSFATYEATKPKKRTLAETLRSCPCGDELAQMLDAREKDTPSYFERTGGLGGDGD